MATEYLQKNKVAEAEMSLQTAVRLKPNNAEALRVLARLQGATGKGPQSLETWQKLAASGGITLDDLAQYSMAASREGDQALAERLANAAAAGGNTVFKHVLRANFLLSKNDIPGAEAEFRQAVEVDTTGNSRAMLARFLLTRRLNAETAPEIREMLRELSKRPDAVGLEALTAAITRGLVPPAELPVWISALRQHPKSTAQALLLADATDIQLQPETKPAVVAKMLERMQGASLEDRARGLQFLLRMEEPAQAASLLTRHLPKPFRKPKAPRPSFLKPWPTLISPARISCSTKASNGPSRIRKRRRNPFCVFYPRWPRVAMPPAPAAPTKWLQQLPRNSRTTSLCKTTWPTWISSSGCLWISRKPLS